METKLNQLSSKYLLLVQSTARDQHLQSLPPTETPRSSCATLTVQTDMSRGQPSVHPPQMDTVDGVITELKPTFVSLDEWISACKLEYLIKYRQWELDYLRGIEQRVLPHISQTIHALASTTKATQEAIAMIRALHVVFGLTSRPVYIDSNQIN